MPDTQFLDGFEQTLRDGLVKICGSCGLLSPGERIPESPDLEDKWENEYLEAFTADAVENFNDYPEATLAWAAYVGMATANGWDRDWARHCGDPYSSFYGPRGFDDMDEHIVGSILHLRPEYADKVKECLYSCAEATLGLIRHQGIEAQTASGFYVLVRAYGVFFEIGAALELRRLGYSMVALDPKKILS